MIESPVTSEKMLYITLVRSGIGYSQKHKDTLRALGLRKINQTVVKQDTPTVQGMLSKVHHLVVIEVRES
jgi:large subunit ribosomal protein L30